MTLTKIITDKELYLLPPEKLEQAINYNFDNKDLLFEALSHPSLKQHNYIRKNYERLEFFGDAIINFIITEILFKEFSAHDEGTLAKIRAYLVSKELLCKVAGKINLAGYIIMTHGEQALGGRKNPNNIENAMEALIAAIYLDSDLTVTKEIISNLWEEFILVRDLANYDPKSTLQELAQNHNGEKPVYELINREGSPHSSIFTVRVTMLGLGQTGSGHSLKEAEKAAARKLITILKSLQNI